MSGDPLDLNSVAGEALLGVSQAQGFQDRAPTTAFMDTPEDSFSPIHSPAQSQPFQPQHKG
jgi:hypothetical protein